MVSVLNLHGNMLILFDQTCYHLSRLACVGIEPRQVTFFMNEWTVWLVDWAHQPDF